MKRMKYVLPFALALILTLCLTACGKGGPILSPSVTEVPEVTVKIGSMRVPVIAQSLNLKPDDYSFEKLLAALPQLTQLKSINFDQAELTREELDALRAATNAEIHYTVLLGGKAYTSEAREVELIGLEPEALPEAIRGLGLLPELVTVTLGRAGDEILLNAEEIATLREAFPGLEVYYELSIGDELYGPRAEKVDLSMLDSESLPAALETMKLLPDLCKITLMDAANETRLTMEDAKLVLDAYPNVKVWYQFELFGKLLSTLDERVEFDGVSLSDDDEPAIRAALDLLPNCTYFKLDEDYYGISNEVMASIRDDYPNTKVVWRVFIDYLNMLTDEEILRISHVVTDDNCEPLKYCTDAVYIDLGHNSGLSDASYTAYMPRLECLVLSGSKVSDISGLANCPNLTWLEICYCGWLTDISPLANVPGLKYLNISGTGVSDISPLENVALERFVAMSTPIPYEARGAFTSQHPDCLTAFEGAQPYGYPWRYNEGVAALFNAFEYYAKMRELFCYYDGDKYWGNHKNSEYGDGYLALRDSDYAQS